MAIQLPDDVVQSLVQSGLAPLFQPGANLQQTQAQIPLTQQEQQTSAQSQATSGQEQQNLQAQNPGEQAQSTTEQVQALQKKAQLGLSADLKNKMTLPSAIGKYTALGMSPDDIFNQYLAESPWGLPNQSPTELQNMGITQKALGQIGSNGSFNDRWNTKQAVLGLRDLKNKYQTVNTLSKIGIGGAGIPTASSQAYDAQREVFGQHLSSLIPGSPGGQGPEAALMSKIPDTGHVSELEPGAANGMFNGVEQGLMNAKGYNYKALGLTAPFQAPANSPQTSQGGKSLLNSLLQTAIPTGGAIAGGIGGGVLGALVPGADLSGIPEAGGAVAGASAGGAGGQALADLLTGKKPGSDVAVTGATSALGEGAGAGIGAILGKAGGALASKVPDDVFNKVVAASPSYTTDITTLKNTANKYGLMNGTTAEGLSKMPTIMNNIGQTIQKTLANVKTPVPLADVSKSILDDFSKQTNAFDNTADFNNAQEYIKNRLYSATGNDGPISKILGGNGQPMNNQSASTTFSKLYQLKSEVAQDLKPVFKAQANPALTTNFTPKQEANLALWSGLKNVIDKASPEIRTLNNDQHNMFDIAKGFVKDASSAKGGGFAGDVFDTLAGNMLGGPGGAFASLVGGRLLRSEGGKSAISKILQGGVTKQATRTAGATVGGGIGALLGM